MKDKPTFAIHEPSPLGIVIEEEELRLDQYREKDRKGMKIHSFYVDGELEHRLGFDICSFVAGEIKDVPVQDASIYDINGAEHEAVVVIHHHSRNGRTYGFLVAPGDETRALSYLRSEPAMI